MSKVALSRIIMEMAARGESFPVVAVTVHWNDEWCVRAQKNYRNGAICAQFVCIPGSSIAPSVPNTIPVREVEPA
jgi:hypothetical protein